MSGSVLDDGESKPAPGTLRLVQAFVNTHNLYDDLEHLPSVDSLQAWLESTGLMESGVSASERDLEIAAELREALRDLLEPNNSDSHARTNLQAIQKLNRLADSLPVKVRFDDGGHVQVARPASTVREALGVLLGLALYAQASGAWSRLRACANPDCRWIFYDASKNRAGSWCRMSICGNQAKSRAHRERIRALGTGSSKTSDTQGNSDLFPR